jgi:hypothetical protein
MKLLRYIPILCALLLLPACTISGDLKSDIVASASSDGAPNIVVQGLLDAQFNFREAMRVGALDKTDPALACVDSVLADLGVGAAEAERFTPRVNELIGAGSVAYIRARQLEREANGPGFKLSFDCKALIGQIVIDAGKVAARVGSNLPGGGIVTGIARRALN